MSTDFRALCAELLGALDGWHKAVFETGTGWVRPDETYLIDRARAVLAAEADGPAVPEGREPASVAGEPSDEDCWQWYTYCPEEGLEMYSDRKQAQSAAQSIMGSYEVAAHSDGWHEDMESVSWGMLVPIEQAQVVERKTAEPDDEFDEWVKYELRPARYGHQPAPPVEGADCPACEGVPKPGNQPCAVCGRSASSVEREVAEMAWWLRSLEDASVWFESGSPEALKLTRAADLLEQRHLAPVPVNERLPGPEDCDGEGRCWWHRYTPTPEWHLRFGRTGQHNHWLPATALPLPSGEVE